MRSSARLRHVPLVGAILAALIATALVFGSADTAAAAGPQSSISFRIDQSATRAGGAFLDIVQVQPHTRTTVDIQEWRRTKSGAMGWVSVKRAVTDSNGLLRVSFYASNKPGTIYQRARFTYGAPVSRWDSIQVLAPINQDSGGSSGSSSRVTFGNSAADLAAARELCLSIVDVMGKAGSVATPAEAAVIAPLKRVTKADCTGAKSPSQARLFTDMVLTWVFEKGKDVVSEKLWGKYVDQILTGGVARINQLDRRVKNAFNNWIWGNLSVIGDRYMECVKADYGQYWVKPTLACIARSKAASAPFYAALGIKA